MDNSNLLAFKAISEFVTDMASVFGSKQRSLALYARLIEKTTLSHTDVIKKHVSKFKSFCIANRNTIQTKNNITFDPKSIQYSDRVFINIETVLKMADSDEKIIIWRHLLTIAALVDTKSKAKNILANSTKEGDFIEKAFEDIKSNIDSASVDMNNPMASAIGLLSTGAFQNIISGLTTGVNDGSLDVNKLMGTVQGMLSGLQTEMKSCDVSPPKLTIEEKHLE